MIKALAGLFFKLEAKVRYVFYFLLLTLGGYSQLKRAIKKAEKQRIFELDVKQGLKMWEKKDEIDRKVELMGDADIDKWLRSNKEWFNRSQSYVPGIKAGENL